MASLQRVDWVLLDPAAPDPVAVGDVLSVEAGGMPIYRVAGLAGGRVLLEDGRHPPVQVASLNGFRWKGLTH